MALIEIVVEVVEETFGLDADLGDQTPRDIGVAARPIETLTAAIANQRASAHGKLVAFGMPAKVVVVVE